jgi:septum site-determining protein MinC
LSAALKNASEQIRVDLRGFNTFTEIKRQLKRKLQRIDGYELGTLVSLEIGYKNLSSKQVREIEDILLDHGLHLKELRSDKPLAEQENEDYPFADIPQYSDTTLICRHLRSGQKIFCEGNIVILGDINPGAEVIAGGNIMVMGSLKGMAHAGAFGDETAVISAYRLCPTQIRIANHITRPPDGEAIVVSMPETARIRAGKVVIEKLKI